MKLTFPTIMSMNAGYVDTAGFLALQGLFTAHVTGNFVTLGASMVFGTSGATAKLLALPVFCLVVTATRLLSSSLPPRGLPVLRTLLSIQFILLVIGAVLAIRLGPFTNGDALSAIVTGMVLVSAMAIQNAVHRIYLSDSPPTTLMTGTTTQIMIDIADLLRGMPEEARESAKGRLRRMTSNVLIFASGCAAGAFFYAQFYDWCFIVPPLLAIPPIFMAASKAES